MALRSRNAVLSAGGPARLPEGCCVLAIISKAPQAGRVKTRLVPPLTAEQAAALHAAFLQDMSKSIAACAALAGLVPVQGGVVYTPVGSEEVFNGLLPESFVLLLQGEGNLGDRLCAAVEQLLALGAASVCLLNSDSPTLPAKILEDAVRRLSARDRSGAQDSGEQDSAEQDSAEQDSAAQDSAAQDSAAQDKVVLGPAEDGGYYLIGLKHAHRRLFEEIAWSTDAVLRQTLQRAAEIALPVELLEPWFDVDDADGLRRLMREEADGTLQAAHTREAVRSMLREGLAVEGSAARPQEADRA